MLQSDMMTSLHTCNLFLQTLWLMLSSAQFCSPMDPLTIVSESEIIDFRSHQDFAFASHAHEIRMHLRTQFLELEWIAQGTQGSCSKLSANS